MATPNQPTVDNADVFIGWSGGNVKLTQLKGFTINDEMTREGIITLGNPRPIGSVQRPGAQTIELDLQPNVKEEVPYARIMASGEIIRINLQYKGGGKSGQRWHGLCQVQSVAPPEADSGGDVSQRATLLVIGELKQVA